MITTGSHSGWNNTGTVVAGVTANGTFTADSGTLTLGGGTFSGAGSGMTALNTGGVVINTLIPLAGGLLGAWLGGMTGNMITEASRLAPYIVALNNSLLPLFENVVKKNKPESIISDTSNSKVVNLAAYRHILRRIPSQTDTLDENTPGSLKDDPQSRFETKQLISEFLEDLQTEESMENYELAISDIIDRHEKTGIAALEAQLFRPPVEPLSWKFLGALGVRRGLPLDNLAKRILLVHLNSTSAGRRSAAASALGAFPDGVVLTALERRAAIETNRIVLATLKAHIRVLRRDGLLIAKIA